MDRPTGAEAFVPCGYSSCIDCGEFWVRGSREGTRCEECAAALSATSRNIEVVASIEGRTLVSRPTRARRRKPHRLTADEAERKRLWNRARSKATQRLVRIHHDLYLSLLAQSKAELGLDPRTDERSVGAQPIHEAMIRRSDAC